MEDGVHKPEDYAEDRQSTWKLPFIMCLTLSAGIGGLIFGYDAGVISGVLFVQGDLRFFYIKETMVTMAIVGAIVGAAIGGWMNDKHGRRTSILVADLLSMAGAIIMAFAPIPKVMIIGRILMGLGVGMLSMASPLYISEASPTRIRGALVGTNCLLYAVGILLFHLTNLAFPKAPGTWRWLVGVGGIPALVQFILMFFLPESPRWLYRQNREEEAVEILLKICSQHEVNTVVESLKALGENEKANPIVLDSKSMKEHIALVQRGLFAGIINHMCQQFLAVSVKVVMYFTTTGFASNKMVLLALPFVTSGLGVVGSIVTITFVDGIGRRLMMLMSAFVTFFWQFVLVLVFMYFENHPLGGSELLWVGAFIISYSTGIATVGWIVSSEVYPLRERGMSAGIAAVSYWVLMLLVKSFSSSFIRSTGLSPAEAILYTSSISFGLSVVAVVLIPETKGLPLEEVENMLRRLVESEEKKPIESSQALGVPVCTFHTPHFRQAGGARPADTNV